jgi:hypothetical protein
MFRRFHPLLVAALLVTSSWTAAAQQPQPLRLEIRAGLVTLRAQNVSLRQILTEWARIGGTRIVNLERVTGAPVTLELTGVTERQALDTLLRNVAGYVLGSRPASATGASAFDRILILASSTAPRTGPAPAVANGPAGRVPQPQFDPNDPEENPQGDRPQVTRTPFPINRPGGNVSTGDQTQPDPPDPSDTPGLVVITPSNPFGVPAGSGAPGTISPVPPQQPQPQGNIQAPD